MTPAASLFGGRKFAKVHTNEGYCSADKYSKLLVVCQVFVCALLILVPEPVLVSA